MKLLIVLISVFLGMIPQGKAFLDPLQKRDSVLIADQLEYGFELQGVGKGTVLALPDFSAFPEDTGAGFRLEDRYPEDGQKVRCHGYKGVCHHSPL